MMNARKARRLRRRIRSRHFYNERHEHWLGEWYVLFNMSPTYSELMDYEATERMYRRIRAQVRWYERKLMEGK